METQEKARVFLNNGQSFLSPLANIETVRRIYGGKIEKIVYADKTDNQPQFSEKKSILENVAVDNVTEPVEQQSQNQEADYTESEKRLEEINKEVNTAVKTTKEETKEEKLFIDRKDKMIKAGFEYNEALQEFERGKQSITKEEMLTLTPIKLGKLIKKTN